MPLASARHLSVFNSCKPSITARLGKLKRFAFKTSRGKMCTEKFEMQTTVIKLHPYSTNTKQRPGSFTCPRFQVEFAELTNRYFYFFHVRSCRDGIRYSERILNWARNCKKQFWRTQFKACLVGSVFVRDK